MIRGRRLSSIVWAGLLALPALSSAAQPDAAQPDVVPLHFINGLPFVEVQVGAAHGEMMFDSGGQFDISIPESLAARAGTVAMLPEKAKFKDIHGQVYEVPKLIAKEVVVGHTRLAPVHGRVNVLWGGAPEGPEAELTRARAGGAISLDAFGDHRVMFDYARGTMTIYAAGKGPQPGDAGWQTLDLAFDKIGPHVMLSVADKPLEFVLDTGAPYVLLKSGSLPAGASAICPAATPTRDCDPTLLPDLRDGAGHPLGALHAQRVPLGAMPFDGLLGAPFFSGRRVLFDVAAHRLLIAAPDAAGKSQ